MQLLVLDEADTLFDRNLKDKTEMIINYLPQRRQNLMFSATVNEEIQRIAATKFRNNYQYIDTVGEEDATVPTVHQEYVSMTPYQTLSALTNIIEDECRRRPFDHKVLIFHSNITSFQYVFNSLKNEFFFILKIIQCDWRS